MSTLPLTKSYILQLDILQRKMLRRIIGWRRHPDEDWHSTMRRMNDRMSKGFDLYQWKNWSEIFARSQWNMANHILRYKPRTWSKSLSNDSQLIFNKN